MNSDRFNGMIEYVPETQVYYSGERNGYCDKERVNGIKEAAFKAVA